MTVHPNVRRRVDEDDRILILAVVTDQQEAELRRVVAHTRWQLKVVHSIAEAVGAIRTLPISVVLCDRELGDGNWLDLVRETEHIDPRPTTIVLSDHHDERLWADVLSCGAYDLLLKPINAHEVYTLVPMAWSRWNRSATAIKKTLHRKHPAMAMAHDN